MNYFLEVSWMSRRVLPAQCGPFYAILRVYMPAPEVLNGTWKKPPMQPASSNSTGD